MLAFDVYRHWETDLRPFTLAALRKLSPEQLSWAPTGMKKSAWDLALSMVECEWTWIYRNALVKAPWSEEWVPSRFQGLEDLLPFWEKVHRASVEWLKDNPVRELSRKYPMPSLDVPYATMNWMIAHTMELEAHHRGQIYLLMQMQGVRTPSL